MDRLFYSVEMIGTDKVAHILAELVDRCSDYLLYEFVYRYLTVDAIKDMGRDLTSYLCYSGNQVYVQNMSESEAQYCCEHYHSGRSGSKLDLFSFSKDTSSGEYWCDIQTL